MWSPQQTLLALALALLGAGAWWLLREGAEVGDPRSHYGRLPDYVVQRFDGIETDATGRPARRLVADQLRQYNAEDLAELDRPRLTQFETDGPPWESESRHGVVLSGGREIQLRDEVRIDRAGFGSSRPVRIGTSELRIWPKREYAQSDRPVRIDSGQDWLTASGARLWYAEPSRAVFSGRVHVYGPERYCRGANRGARPMNPRTAPCRRSVPAAIALACGLASAGQCALALTGDDQQPMLIEADRVEVDQGKNTSIYIGNVQVDQGSMRLLADHVTVYHRPDRQVKTVIALGAPANYKQLLDGDDGEVHAFAKRMEFDADTNELTLIDDALVIQGADRISSQRIVYDRTRARMRAGGSGRVKITITPEPEGAQPPPSVAAPAAGAAPARGEARP